VRPGELPAQQAVFLDREYRGVAMGGAFDPKGLQPLEEVVFAGVPHRAQRYSPMTGAHCKSLFLKDKKDQLWLLVALEDRPVDLKTLPKNIGAARLSFGKPELLLEVLGVEPGSVTPFALINDPQGRVRVVLDKGMLDHELLNYHPLTNTATTAISAADLVRFIRSCGHDPVILDFDDLI
jgi:Ala-tRNA(Pro) deacylase